MSRLLQVRLAVATIGITVWGYGIFNDEPQVRLVGIVVLAVTLALRFVPKRFQGPKGDGTPAT